MEKVTYLALFACLLVFIAGCAQEPKKEINLEFSSAQLDRDPGDLGVQKIDWLNDTTLQVRGYMFINCAASVSNSEYAISGNKIKLMPNITFPDPEKDYDGCLEPYELVYKFNNLEKKNYEIKFDEGS